MGVIIKPKIKLVFEESRLESKIRYSDPEVTLIRDNKKMSDVCVQDRKCAFGEKGRERREKKKKPTHFHFTQGGVCSVGKKIWQNLIPVIKLG